MCVAVAVAAGGEVRERGVDWVLVWFWEGEGSGKCGKTIIRV